MTDYQLPMFERLEPRTPFKGGRITDNDVLTLPEAARFASVHAGTEITSADILRAGARGEITIRAICPRSATMEPCRESDQPLTMPENCIPTLPLDACKALNITGRAEWRTIDGFEPADSFAGELCRFTRWQLSDTEPDIVTTLDACRVTGWDIHSLADAYIDKPAPAQSLSSPAPDEAWKTKAQDRAREIIKDLRERDLYPSQKNLAHLISVEFRKAGIIGTDGKPITGAYIKRHALKGISSATGKQFSTTIGRGKWGNTS
jgi:hypothetical protein